MTSFGKFDTREFDNFVAEFEDKANGKLIVEEIEKAMTKTAGIALNKVKKKTPTAKKHGGTLKRGWSASNLKSFGGVFMIDIYNNTEYAPYIENGHRIVRSGRTVGYVPGVFMLKETIDEIDRQWDNTIGKSFNKAIQDMLGG